MADFSKSRICTLLGIRRPIFQGGMAWIATPELAAAVSEAGGLGILTSVWETVEQFRDHLRRLRQKTTRPFGVNLMLRHPGTAEIARIVAEERVPVVTTGAGDPQPYMASWLAADIRIIPVVSSVGYARLMERRGAAAVIAEGTEAGGHIGTTSTLCLVPQVVDAVKIPVVAAGGIGDGRGMAAAFMLGAEGIQMGTRFLAARECDIHRRYKEKLLQARDTGTVVTGGRYGRPIRSLKTPFSVRMAELEGNESCAAPQYAELGAGALKRAVASGDLEKGCFMAGQIAGLIQKEQSAGDILDEVEGQAAALMGPYMAKRALFDEYT